MANEKLNKARYVKNDEFYTRLVDIEKEMKYHAPYFVNKVVYCNCDNHEWSNFAKYFCDNFHALELKKLIVTGLGCGSMIMDADGIKTYPPIGTGAFASPQSMAYLKQADVVVTNPPFSLFRNFIDLLFLYKKDFLIVGGIGAVTYKNMFPHIRSGRVSIGMNEITKFTQPDGTIKPVYAIWHTTLPLPNNQRALSLDIKYNPTMHPVYLDYDAINVDRCKDIPCDYDGIMGVPVSYLTKHNSNEFDIIGYKLKGRLPCDEHGERIVFVRLLIKRRVNGTGVTKPTASGYSHARQPDLI